MSMHRDQRRSDTDRARADVQDSLADSVLGDVDVADPVHADLVLADLGVGKANAEFDQWAPERVALELAAAELELAFMVKSGEMWPMPERAKSLAGGLATGWIAASTASDAHLRFGREDGSRLAVGAQIEPQSGSRRAVIERTVGVGVATEADASLKRGNGAPGTEAMGVELTEASAFESRLTGSAAKGLGEAWLRPGGSSQGGGGLWLDPANRRSSTSRLVPWLVAAAAIVLAGLMAVRTGSLGPMGSMALSSKEMNELVKVSEDVIRRSFNDWDSPEVTGVQGDIVWSDKLQAGFVKLVGLPANDAARPKYQLWIIDEERGMEQRVSGALFDTRDQKECLVPVRPLIPVGKAVAFALTIEGKDGTWVSDMKRRVVIAKRERSKS